MYMNMKSSQVECLLDSFTSTRTAQNLHASRAVSTSLVFFFFLNINLKQILPISISVDDMIRGPTKVRLLQLQWNERGGLAGASLELALPDTARLLR